MTSSEQPTIDYRSSHLDKGRSYDSTLCESAFDTYLAKWEAYHTRRLVTDLFSSRVPRYLDFACGTGRITEIVAPLAKESVGVDISESMLEVARTKCPSTRFINEDLTRETPNLARFDLVTSFRFFGNAQDELRKSALRAINGLLRHSGYLIINNHRNPYSLASLLHTASGSSHGMDLHHFKLKRLLHETGFAVIRRRAIGVWIFRARMMQEDFLRRVSDDLWERWLDRSCLAPIAPDAIVVAKKIEADGR